MRTYEFALEDCKCPILTVCIEEEGRNKDKISTTWRDIEGHFAKARMKVQTSTEMQRFKEFTEQIKDFWKMVCRSERSYGPTAIDDIINSIVDPDLKEFLVQNS